MAEVVLLATASTLSGAAMVAFLVADAPPDIARDACQFFRWWYLGIGLGALALAALVAVYS